jgi:glutamate formiminotransferase
MNPYLTKTSTENVLPVLPFQQLEQNRCVELIPVMGKAVQKKQSEPLGKRKCFWYMR